MTDAKRVIRTMLIMLALLASALVIQVPTASAGIPSVTLTTSMSGTHYILNVTVDHPATIAISNSHYVDQVQIVTSNSSGDNWVNVTLSGSVLVDAQTNVTFYFSYDIGSLALNTSISGTAHCVIHGWGAPGTVTAGPASASVPSAPQSLVATAGNGSVVLTWAAPSSFGSSPITNYTVYRGTSTGSLTSYKVLGNVTTYNDTAATNGITYYYAVTATSSVGESVKSSEVSATPTGGGGTTPPTTPADNTMLIVAIVLIVIVVIVIAAVMMMRRKGGAEKPKE